MALFGKETEADQQRANDATAWIRARPPLALVSVGLGILSILDCWTLVIGVVAGVGAIVTSRLALRDLPPEAPGRRLCYAGMTLGILGIIASLVMMTIVYPAMNGS